MYFLPTWGLGGITVTCLCVMTQQSKPLSSFSLIIPTQGLPWLLRQWRGNLEIHKWASQPFSQEAALAALAHSWSHGHARLRGGEQRGSSEYLEGERTRHWWILVMASITSQSISFTSTLTWWYLWVFIFMNGLELFVIWKSVKWDETERAWHHLWNLCTHNLGEGLPLWDSHETHSNAYHTLCLSPVLCRDSLPDIWSSMD